MKHCDRIPHFLNEKAYAYLDKTCLVFAHSIHVRSKHLTFDGFWSKDCDRKFVIVVLIILNQSQIDFERIRLLSSFRFFYRLVLRQFDSLFICLTLNHFDQSFLYKCSSSLIQFEQELNSIQIPLSNSMNRIETKVWTSTEWIESKQENFNGDANSRLLFVMQRNLEFDRWMDSFKTISEIDPL